MHSGHDFCMQVKIFDICHNLCMSSKGLKQINPEARPIKNGPHILVYFQSWPSMMAVLVGILSKKWAKTPKKEHLSDQLDYFPNHSSILAMISECKLKSFNLQISQISLLPNGKFPSIKMLLFICVFKIQYPAMKLQYICWS